MHFSEYEKHIATEPSPGNKLLVWYQRRYIATRYLLMLSVTAYIVYHPSMQLWYFQIKRPSLCHVQVHYAKLVTLFPLVILVHRMLGKGMKRGEHIHHTRNVLWGVNIYTTHKTYSEGWTYAPHTKRIMRSEHIYHTRNVLWGVNIYTTHKTYCEGWTYIPHTKRIMRGEHIYHTWNVLWGVNIYTTHETYCEGWIYIPHETYCEGWTYTPHTKRIVRGQHIYHTRNVLWGVNIYTTHETYCEGWTYIPRTKRIMRGEHIHHTRNVLWGVNIYTTHETNCEGWIYIPHTKRIVKGEYIYHTRNVLWGVNIHHTRNILWGVSIYGLLAVALYSYHIYYNNTFFAALFFPILHFQLSLMYNNSPVNLLSVFVSTVDLSLIYSIQETYWEGWTYTPYEKRIGRGEYIQHTRNVLSGVNIYTIRDTYC